MNNMINFDRAKMSILLAVTKACNNMAFLDVTESNNENLNFKNRIQFYFFKPFQGNIVLFFMDDLKNRIVENIYGEKALKLSPEMKEDCISEMMNIIAGNFLSLYFGDNEYEKNEVSHDNGSNSSYLISSFFNAEELKFKIVLFIDCN